MSITKTKEKVRDGFLGDLPSDLQTKVMDIHKLIKDTARDILDEDNYEDLKKSSWAMSCIDEFCVMPKDKTEVGSFRVYKRGKVYRCMIQATGHFTNHQYGWIEELLHDFICNVYTTVRPKIRKKYDMTITNEGRTGQPYEGFDIYPNPRSVKDIWDSLDDRKTKTITENTNYLIESNKSLRAQFSRLYFEVQRAETQYIQDNFKLFWDVFDEVAKSYSDVVDSGIYYALDHKYQVGEHEARIDYGKYPEGCYDIILYSWNTGKIKDDKQLMDRFQLMHSELKSKTAAIFKQSDCAGEPLFDEMNGYGTLYWILDTVSLNSKLPEDIQMKQKQLDEYSRQLEESGDDSLRESYKTTKAPKDVDDLHNIVNGHRQGRGYIREAASSDTPEYNVSMSEREAKKTLATLSQSIINDIANKKDYKVSQYTANIYANIITKNLLPLWAKGFRKLSITLDSYQSLPTFEFKVPTMTQDFVARFVNGRESLNGFIHRQPEIKIKMSPHIFHTMKEANDAYSFFKAAIKYYDSSLERYGNKMMIDVMKLNHEMKHLISTTKLSGLVVYPLSLLFKFDNVQMDNRDTFRITQDDIKSINQFMRNIYTKYADPSKERKRVVDDVQEMVKALRESSDLDDVNVRSLIHFPEAVDTYLSGGFDKEINYAHEAWIKEHVDIEWSYKNSDPQIKYLQEKFGVKKLKKIPSDLVAYISIETEAIKDANDKMMISSYCLGKIEIVEWYIELLDVGSKKYIVPHTKPYLEGVRTQLLACFKKIMDTPIPKKDRPLIDIQYPKGYEG